MQYIVVIKYEFQTGNGTAYSKIKLYVRVITAVRLIKLNCYNPERAV